MARTCQCLSIIGGLLVAAISAYLYHLPNSDGIPQINRVRMLAAFGKTIHFVGRLSENFGQSNGLLFLRDSGVLVKKLKQKPQDPTLETEDTTIEGVPVRIYRPLNLNDDQNKFHPAIVYYHGGAFYLGSIDTHDSITRALARQTEFIVISVDYRLAPEHPFPVGLDDCTAVTKHVLDVSNANKLRIDPTRVAIVGDSSGGNFAAVIAMRLSQSRNKQQTPRLQVLIYPVVQFFDFMLPSLRQPMVQIFRYGSAAQILSMYLNKTIDKSIHNNNHMTVNEKKHYRSYVDWSLIPENYREIYQKPLTDDIEGDPILVSNAKQMLHSDISPLLVDNNQLAKLPPTYLATVEHDRLRDEEFIYAARVRASGVPIVHRHFNNTFHGVLGFFTEPYGLNVAKEMLDDISNYLKDHL